MGYISEDYCSEELSGMLMEKGYIGTTNTYLDKNGINVKQITIQSAMKYLREVHYLHISIEMGFDVDNRQYFFFVPSICKFSSKTGEYQTPFGEKEFDTYGEACNATIKYCLKNLI